MSGLMVYECIYCGEALTQSEFNDNQSMCQECFNTPVDNETIINNRLLESPTEIIEIDVD